MTTYSRKQYFRVIKELLIRAGAPSIQLTPKTSLKDDLKLSASDYYFLKVDIEELLQRSVDTDLVFESKTVSDLISLMMNLMEAVTTPEYCECKNHVISFI